MSWQILIGVSIMGAVTAWLLQRTLLKEDKSDPIAYSIIFQIVTGLLIGMFAFIRGFHIPHLQPLLPNLLLMPVLYLLANIFIFRSLKLTEASTFTILFSGRAIWIILLSIILLHESFTLQQSVGTVLILAGIFIVSLKDKKFRLQKGELFAIAAAVAFGAAIVNDSFVVQKFDVPSYYTISFLIPGFLMWIVFPKSTPKIMEVVRTPTFYKIIVLAAVYGISSITYMLAYTVGKNAAQIASISQVSTVLTVIVAIFLLNERKNIWKKVIAAVISFIGVLLVT